MKSQLKDRLSIPTDIPSQKLHITQSMEEEIRDGLELMLGRKSGAINALLEFIQEREALAVQQERGRIINIVETNKDLFMVPAKEIRFINLINKETNQNN